MPHLLITKLLNSSPIKTTVPAWLSPHMQTHHSKELPESKRYAEGELESLLAGQWQSWKTELEGISQPKSYLPAWTGTVSKHSFLQLNHASSQKQLCFLTILFLLEGFVGTSLSDIRKLPISSLNFFIINHICMLSPISTEGNQWTLQLPGTHYYTMFLKQFAELDLHQT